MSGLLQLGLDRGVNHIAIVIGRVTEAFDHFLPDHFRHIVCVDLDNLTEESGCIDEAEAALECGQNADFDSLTCEDDLLAELSKCEEPGTAWNECVGG